MDLDITPITEDESIPFYNVEPLERAGLLSHLLLLLFGASVQVGRGTLIHERAFCKHKKRARTRGRSNSLCLSAHTCQLTVRHTVAGPCLSNTILVPLRTSSSVGVPGPFRSKLKQAISWTVPSIATAVPRPYMLQYVRTVASVVIWLPLLEPRTALFSPVSRKKQEQTSFDGIQ